MSADTRPSHSITITVTGRYPHGDAQHAKVEVGGEGDLDHFIDAFRAALVAAGHSCGTAERLDVHPGIDRDPLHADEQFRLESER